MTSRYSRRPPHHWPPPICIAPPAPPGVRTGLFPTFLNAQVTFRPSPDHSVPAEISGFFQNIPIDDAHRGEQTVLTGGSWIELTLQFNALGTTLYAVATLNSQTETLGAFRTAATTLAPANPIEQTWNDFVYTLPAGLSGQIKTWE